MIADLKWWLKYNKVEIAMITSVALIIGFLVWVGNRAIEHENDRAGQYSTMCHDGYAFVEFEPCSYECGARRAMQLIGQDGKPVMCTEKGGSDE